MRCLREAKRSTATRVGSYTKLEPIGARHLATSFAVGNCKSKCKDTVEKVIYGTDGRSYRIASHYARVLRTSIGEFAICR